MKYFKLLLTSICVIALLPTSIAQPVNNEVAGAITLNVVPGDAYNNNCTPTTTISWTGATQSTNGIWSCSLYNGNPDVWYKITVPASGAYRVVIAPANGVNPLEDGYQVSLAALDQWGNISSYIPCTNYWETEYPVVNTSGRTPGSTEYIRIWKQMGVPNGNLKICIMEVAPMAPSTQKVGVGISSPRANFDVNGNMHVQGNFTTYGRIGMGVSNPQFNLDMVGRIKLRSDPSKPETPGIWFNRFDNSGNPPIFMGLQSDSIAGFYSTGGIDWNGLTMNYRTGRVTMGGGINLGSIASGTPLQFSNSLGLTKISLYKGPYGDVGIGAYGGELRLQNDIPNGKVSMGVIEANGNYTELAKAERGNGYAFTIWGNLYANGTTYASDGRFKKDIEPLQESLDKVLQMQGVSYNMKTEEFPNEHFTTAHQVGLIAQDIEKIVPEVVSEGPTGYKAIDYAKLVPLLIESIKTQQAQIQAMQQEIQALKRKKQGK